MSSRRYGSGSPDVLGGIHSAIAPSVSAHYSIDANFVFDVHAEDEDILYMKLSCSRALSARPPAARSLIKGHETDDWIDFFIEDGANDLARLATVVLPGNAHDASTAYEEAVESYVDSIEEFLPRQIDLIFEKLAFMRLLSGGP
jgi:hypothetical protein